MNTDAVRKVKNSKPFTVLDGVVLAALIAVVAVCAVFIYRAPPSTVTVKSDGYDETFSLGENRSIELGHLTVHIEDGKVWVTDADCADKTCEHTGKISRSGQSIVCLPNNIVITIGGKGDLQWEIGR